MGVQVGSSNLVIICNLAAKIVMINLI